DQPRRWTRRQCMAKVATLFHVHCFEVAIEPLQEDHASTTSTGRWLRALGLSGPALPPRAGLFDALDQLYGRTAGGNVLRDDDNLDVLLLQLVRELLPDQAKEMRFPQSARPEEVDRQRISALCEGANRILQRPLLRLASDVARGESVRR